VDGDPVESEIYVPTLLERLEPVVIGMGMWIMNAGFVVGVLTAVYLLFGVLSGGLGGFNAEPKPERLRILANLLFASQTMRAGLAVGAIGAAMVFFREEAIGYILLLGSALLGLAIPYVCRLTANGQANSFGVDAALAAFVSAAVVPAGVGALLVARDIVLRLAGAVRNRTLDHKELTYGSEAQAERRPIRTSLLAKCWEGPYCREFIRVHCPIFIARKACWREKRGCYCEEDIVSAAAAHVNGVVLDMAPDPKYNFANRAQPLGGAANPYRKPELSQAQKIERCKYCVIYNEHEREKYQLLVPVTMVATVAGCALLATNVRGLIGTALQFSQNIADRFSFHGTTDAQFSQPSEVIEWILVAAFTIIVLSKILQVLEWACFKAKI
jgi:hypothetical protein